MNSPIYEVKRTGRTWSVYVGGKLVEGGFFAKQAAIECRDRLFEETEFPSRYRRDREDFGADSK